MTVSAAILYLAACISDVIHKIGQYDISINYVTSQPSFFFFFFFFFFPLCLSVSVSLCLSLSLSLSLSLPPLSLCSYLWPSVSEVCLSPKGFSFLLSGVGVHSVSSKTCARLCMLLTACCRRLKYVFLASVSVLGLSPARNCRMD